MSPYNTILGWILVGLITLSPPDAHATVTVTLSSTLDPSSYGETVKFVASLEDPPNAPSTLKGFVAFTEGGVVLGNRTVSSGAASFSTRYLTGGDHSIAANYWPSGGGPAITSNEIVQHVTLGKSNTTISTTNATAYNGRPGSIKAKVKAISPAFGIPTGSVEFYLEPYDPNGVVSPYYTALLDGTGTAVFDFMYLYGPGTYTVTAVYTGDTNFDQSVSTVLTQVVLPNAPTALASFSPITVTAGSGSKLTISAYNPTPYAMTNAALGVLLKAPYTVISRPSSSCGARPGFYYCNLSLAAGATKSLVLQVTPPSTTASGTTIVANSYARNTNTNEETYATATLTVQ